MLQLLIDHRERRIAAEMAALCPSKIRAVTLTVGDFVFTGADEAILLIIERKTLRDLADSIRDGRMENNDKLMTARKVSRCRIAYLIEAADPYQSPATKHGGITFGALTAKLDSLMLRFGVSVIWTRDPAHTITRLSAMFLTFMRAIEKHGAPPRREGEPDPAAADEKQIEGETDEPGAGPDEKQIEGGGAGPDEKRKADAPRVADVVQFVPPIPSVADMRLKMLMLWTGPEAARALLARFDLATIVLGQVSGAAMSETMYNSGRRIGQRGYEVAEFARDTLASTPRGVIPAQFLSKIHSLSLARSEAICAAIPLRRLVALDFAPGAVANIMCGVRRIGPAREARIRAVFALRTAPNIGAIV